MHSSAPIKWLISFYLLSWIVFWVVWPRCISNVILVASRCLRNACAMRPAVLLLLELQEGWGNFQDHKHVQPSCPHFSSQLPTKYSHMNENILDHPAISHFSIYFQIITHTRAGQISMNQFTWKIINTLQTNRVMS